MARQIPSLQDIYNKIKSSIFSFTEGQLEVEKDPFARSFAQADTVNTDYVYNIAQDSIAQTFSQSATEESFLTGIAFDKTNNTIKRQQAESAQGKLVVTSSAGVDVPQGTQFITSDAEIYENLVLKTCETQTFFITSVVRNTGFAVATLVDHDLGSNMDINVAGINEADFNGLQEIEVLTKDTFRWASPGVDVTATGSITGEFFGCRVDVQSVNNSEAVNKTFTDIIDLAQTINFVEEVFITFNGITGGKDIETLDSFKANIVEYLENPENKGNLNQHQIWSKQKTDANYAYFFTSEDDFSIFLTGVLSKVDDEFNFTSFSANELADIKNQFIAENQLLLGVDALNLSIVNPSFVDIDVTINGLTPDTVDMRNAIDLILKEYISLLTIDFYLSAGYSELSNDKINTIVSIARDSNGNSPSYTSLSVSGTSGLDADTKKPILGTVTYA